MITWPPVQWETRSWSPSTPNSSARERARRTGDYAALLPPKIAGCAVELGSLGAELEDAALALRRCHDRAVSTGSPLPLVLLRPEAASSSRIEAITAGARAIAEAALGRSGRRNADLVVANVRALESAIDSAENLCTESLLDAHRVLLAGADTSPSDASQADAASPALGFRPGAWRDAPVWIGTSHHVPVGDDFVAPDASLVPELMEDLVRFALRDDVPAVAHAAIAHAQFETIHPFPDGNGRIGRALVHAMFKRDGVAPEAALPLSAGLLSGLEEYFAALESYRTGDVEPIIRVFVAAAAEATANVSVLLDELDDIRASWRGSLRMRGDSRAWEVLDVLAELGVVDSDVLSARLGIAKSNAIRLLAPLSTAGIVVETSGRRRNRIWRAPEVIAAYDAFAERSGRRQGP